MESLIERANVAKIAHRDDDPVGNFPVKLPDDFNADRFLTLNAQTIHRVSKVNRIVLRHFLDNFHTAIEVGIEREHVRAVGNRLD